MPFVLRGYQGRTVNEAWPLLLQGAPLSVPCVVAPTGSGKTVMIAEMTRRALAHGHRVAVIAHREEIIGQIVGSLRHHLGALTRIEAVTAGARSRYQAAVTVGMVPTLARRTHTLHALRGCTLLADECFPAGTLIDGRPIETLQPGDLLRCWDHTNHRVVLRPVVRLFKSQMPPQMVRLTLKSGLRLVCTAGHPFWVEGTGYVFAIMLRPRDVLKLDPHYARSHPLQVLPGDRYGLLQSTVRNATGQGKGLLLQGLPTPRQERGAGASMVDNEPQLFSVWRGSHRTDESSAEKPESHRKSVLLRGLQQGLSFGVIVRDDGSNEQEIRIRSDEGAQPYAQRRIPRQVIEDLAPYRPQGANQRRQRKACAPAAADASRRAELADGIHCAHAGTGESYGLPQPLQDRHSEPVIDGSDRGGRQIALHAQKARAGQEEGRLPAIDWVESVEILESSSLDRPRGMRGEGKNRYVYNVEVEEHHNYFAEGVLVHNCHHVGADSWQSVIKALAPRHMAGFTATPVRPDGRGLGDGSGFTHLVLGPQPGELIAAGALCRYRMFAAPHAIESKGLRKRGGDFAAGAEMERRVVEVNGHIVPDWQRFNPGRARTICVAVSVEHAHQVAELFREAGVPAEAVDGSTPKGERAAIFQRFRSGRTVVLCACAVIDEGLDVPEATVLQVLRPTASLRLWRQLVGRVLRPATGKEEALIIDHTDNWKRLPAPDLPIDWQLNSEMQEPKERVVPQVDETTMQVSLVTAAAPLEVDENGAELVELTPELLAESRPDMARRLLNQRCLQEIHLLQAGHIQRERLMSWTRRAAILEDATVKALGQALNMPPGWADGQLLLQGLVHPNYRLAATRQAQQEILSGGWVA